MTNDTDQSPQSGQKQTIKATATAISNPPPLPPPPPPPLPLPPTSAPIPTPTPQQHAINHHQQQQQQQLVRNINQLQPPQPQPLPPLPEHKTAVEQHITKLKQQYKRKQQQQQQQQQKQQQLKQQQQQLKQQQQQQQKQQQQKVTQNKSIATKAVRIAPVPSIPTTIASASEQRHPSKMHNPTNTPSQTPIILTSQQQQPNILGVNASTSTPTAIIPPNTQLVNAKVAQAAPTPVPQSQQQQQSQAAIIAAAAANAKLQQQIVTNAASAATTKPPQPVAAMSITTRIAPTPPTTTKTRPTTTPIVTATRAVTATVPTPTVPAPTSISSLKPLSAELARLISRYLGPQHPRNVTVGATLGSLRDKLESSTNPFVNNRAELTWAVREALRSELHKLIYPNPPPRPLLCLIMGVEMLLSTSANGLGAIGPGPFGFFFPGGRVSAPTSDGSRRVGTALQLRSKQLLSGPVMESMLHLDGPDGGTFQWIQVKALLPLAGFVMPSIEETGISSIFEQSHLQQQQQTGPHIQAGIPPGIHTAMTTNITVKNATNTNTNNTHGIRIGPKKSNARGKNSSHGNSGRRGRGRSGNNRRNKNKNAAAAAEAQAIAMAAAQAAAQAAAARVVASVSNAAAATVTNPSLPSPYAPGSVNATTNRNSIPSTPATATTNTSAAPTPAKNPSTAAPSANTSAHHSKPNVTSCFTKVTNRPSTFTGANAFSNTSSVANVNLNNTSSRGANIETSAVVPTSLICASAPPRERIIGNGRPLSISSGSVRRAIDVDSRTESKQGMQRSVKKLKLIIGVQRLMARRLVEGVGVQYFVKWSGRGIEEASWESRESLIQDLPGLVREFDVRHPEESCPVRLRGKEKDAEKIVNQYDKEIEKTNGKEQESAASNRKEGVAKYTKTETDVTMKEKKEDKQEKGESNSSNKNNTLVQQPTNDKVKEKDKDKENDKKKSRDSGESIEFTDDVSGVNIPSWVDTPIVELSIKGMILQIRRPSEYSLHTDFEAASRDTKRRHADFKKRDIERAAKVYSLSKSEARMAIDHGLRARRELSQRAIPFPRGLGRVAACDVGGGKPALASRDHIQVACWEAYLKACGGKVHELDGGSERDLPPWMPTVPKQIEQVISAWIDKEKLEKANEHRERARGVVREGFRFDGMVKPPAKLFRNDIREPPGTVDNDTDMKSKDEEDVKGNEIGNIENVEGIRMNLTTDFEGNVNKKDDKLLLRDKKEAAQVLKEITKRESNEKKKDNSGHKEGMWFDAVWACWRKAPTTSPSKAKTTPTTATASTTKS